MSDSSEDESGCSYSSESPSDLSELDDLPPATLFPNGDGKDAGAIAESSEEDDSPSNSEGEDEEEDGDSKEVAATQRPASGQKRKAALTPVRSTKRMVPAEPEPDDAASQEAVEEDE
ncbi:MAG: hypothetical protein AB7P49_00620 [Bdellovibrionales bacterium]